MPENTPEIKPQEIPNAVKACPLCGAEYVKPLSAGIKITCPDQDEGGCGRTFTVRIFEKKD